MLDEDEEAVLDLRGGELGEADDFLEGEGPAVEQAAAYLLRRRGRGVLGEGRKRREEGEGRREEGAYGDEIAEVGGDEADGEFEAALTRHRFQDSLQGGERRGEAPVILGMR